MPVAAMEADWEFEIAPDAPVIDAAWAGFIDLRRQPKRIADISELPQLPALRGLLLRLNAEGSGFFTSKCDVWNAGEVDADEFGADRDSAASVLACYVDVLPVEKNAWRTPESAADWARCVCKCVAEMPLRNCRMDMVIRQAFVTATAMSFGTTCYVTGCGATKVEAAESLSGALRAFAEAVMISRPAISRA
jgi:hypothetical protein